MDEIRTAHTSPRILSARDVEVKFNLRGRTLTAVRGASLVGKGSEIIQNIDMVGSDMEMGQGMCGSSSGSVPTNVGQPLIRVSTITVGGR